MVKEGVLNCLHVLVSLVFANLTVYPGEDNAFYTFNFFLSSGVARVLQCLHY